MAEKRGNILVIDDDPDVLTAAQLLLKRHYAQVASEENPERIPEYLRKQNWDVILLDMNFAIGANSGTEGLQWLAIILAEQPGALLRQPVARGVLPVLFMAAVGRGEGPPHAARWQGHGVRAQVDHGGVGHGVTLRGAPGAASGSGERSRGPAQHLPARARSERAGCRARLTRRDCAGARSAGTGAARSFASRERKLPRLR